MKIEYKQSEGYSTPPEYNGVAKIVDSTELKEYETQFGNKEQFRFILELNAKKDNGSYWTIATKPFTPSLHEKASLRKFTEKVLGRALTSQELKSGFDTDALLGSYCHIIVEHVPSQDGQKTFANITFVGKNKEQITWQSGYVPFAARELIAA